METTTWGLGFVVCPCGYMGPKYLNGSLFCPKYIPYTYMDPKPQNPKPLKILGGRYKVHGSASAFIHISAEDRRLLAAGGFLGRPGRG